LCYPLTLEDVLTFGDYNIRNGHLDVDKIENLKSLKKALPM